MSEQNAPEGMEEIVLLFADDGTAVTSEMRLTEFDALVNQAATLDEYAASVVKAAYGVVASGLTLRGLVFFHFKVDEEGAVDASFNVPLRYLVRNAGRAQRQVATLLGMRTGSAVSEIAINED